MRDNDDMKKWIIIAVAVVLLAGALFALHSTRRATAMREVSRRHAAQNAESERMNQQRRLEHTRRLDELEEDPAVTRSILQGLQISMEIQPQWKQETEFLFQVNLQKPLGTAYLVDGLENSCLLYVNNRPRVLLQEEPCSEVRCMLGPDMASLHRLFRMPPGIAAGSELSIEWINYNPRTKEIERLRTKPYIWSG